MGNQEQGIIPIDVELIRRLKNDGHYKEAMALIKAHQESLKKNREQLRSEIRNRMARVENHIIKKLGLCTDCGGEIDTKFRKCRACLDRRKIYARKYKLMKEAHE